MQGIGPWGSSPNSAQQYWLGSDPMLSFAYISQSNQLNLSTSPAVIPFSDPTFHSSDLRIERGLIRITRPGVFHATLSLNVPTGVIAHTRISMQLNRQDLLGALYHIDQATPTSPGTIIYSQCVFEVPDTGTLRVVSSDPLQFLAPSPEATIASLVLLKIR